MNYGTTRHFGIPGDAFLGTFEVLMGEELAENVIISEEDDVKLPANVHVIASRRKLEQIDDALSSKNKFVVRQHVLLGAAATIPRQVRLHFPRYCSQRYNANGGRLRSR